jgi:hypothetical protein
MPEGEPMGKHARRIGIFGFLLAASAAFVLPASASADETLSGSCSTTLQGARSDGLILDLGAPLNLAGKLTIGLDSASGARDAGPALSLPVGDTVRALGVGGLPLVGDTCTVVQGAVNGVGGATQKLLGGKDALPPTKPVPPPGTPGGPTPPSNPGQPAPGSPVTGDDLVLSQFTGAAFVPTSLTSAGPLVIGLAAAGKPPLVVEQDPAPVIIADRSGDARALPASNAPARLPLILAVLLLAVVAAALLRTWMRRKPA